jgi:cell division protease FtsH
MGATHQMPEDDRYVYERDYMLDRLAVMLAGRAAESVALDTTTTGAEDDLRQATSLARRMVVDWGMGDDTGLMVSSQGSDQEVFLGEELTQRRENSEATARLVDDEVRSILEQSYRRAVQVIEEHRDGLDRIARALIEDEKISGERVEELLAESGTPQ